MKNKKNFFSKILSSISSSSSKKEQRGAKKNKGEKMPKNSHFLKARKSIKV